MPVIYYACYRPASDSVSAVSAQEHALGRKLLAKGLRDLWHLNLPFHQMDAAVRPDSCGKPFLPGYPHIHFNITHCSGLAACAFHDHPIGADAELPGYFAEILIRRALSETEKKLLQDTGATLPLRQEWFYRLWTLKEAYVKKSGIGVDTDLTAFSFSFAEDESGLCVTCSDSSVSCYQSKLSSGQILSLCYESGSLKEPVTLVEIRN